MARMTSAERRAMIANWDNDEKPSSNIVKED